MIFQVASDALLFVGFCVGLGGVAATFIPEDAALDRLSIGVGVVLIGLYLANFAVYLQHLPHRAIWLFGIVGLGIGWARRSKVAALWRDPLIPAALRNWALLAMWCLGWQTLVGNYSGAAWSGDWHEHYDRAHFFLQHWPTDFRFIYLYPLPARPPLANLVVGGFLGIAGGAFYHFQVFSCLLSTLVFFPLAGWLHRLRAEARNQTYLTGLLMLSPLFVQNATFPWTKLPTACFIVLAADFLSRSPTFAGSRGHLWGMTALAAALLTHYSTAIWVIALGAAWLVVYHQQLTRPDVRRALGLGMLVGTALFLTWLAWALKTYGTDGTFHLHGATGMQDRPIPATGAGSVLGNVYHTVLPVWWWEGLPPLLDQASPWARLRDRWFCLYQLNLLFAFGLGGMLVMIRLLTATKPGPTRRFWGITTLVSLVVLGAVHPADPLGVTHIALQPLVLMGLAWLAAEASNLPAPWIRLWRIGLAVDLIAGIVLQFAMQSLALARMLHPGEPDAALIGQLSRPAVSNYIGKLYVGAVHLADQLPPLTGVVMIMLAGAGLLVTLRRSPAI